jgi:endoglucanase
MAMSWPKNMPMMNTGRNMEARKLKPLALAIVLSISFLSPGLLRPSLAQACVALTHTVPPDRIAALSRGFNADGWLNGPNSTPPAAGLLQQLREAGMSHVRLPVPAERMMPRFSSKAERDDLLHHLDRALNQLTSLGYSVSVDLHPGDRFNRLHRQDLAAAMKEMKNAWTDLAQVIRIHPSQRVFAELLNEPDVDAGKWQTEVEELAAFVRQRLPDTTLIVGPVNWQRADSLPEFRPLKDLNVVYAIHFYDPMVFTHQGHWDPKEPLHSIRGLPYPIRADDPEVQAIRRQLSDENSTAALEMLDRAIAASRDKAAIDKWLEPAATWQQRFSRPIIVNEFGVLKASAPRDSRLRWLSSVVAYADQHCWGWTHWELAQGFGLVDGNTGKPDAGVLGALLGPR